jgi:glycosyltransferase involved in cell wall biosynthesis
MGFPSVDAYRQQAAQLGLEDHVTFTGKIPYESAPSHLALGDVAVAPKTSATEGSGKLLNYMAMGLATVAFDVPVSREYLGDLGVYAKKGDVGSLARATLDLLVDRDRRATLGRGLRQRAKQHYSWRHAGERIMHIYDRISTADRTAAS